MELHHPIDGYLCGSSPTVVNGVVYIGSDDRSVYALNASTGTELWRFSTRDGVAAHPPSRMGWSIRGCENGNMYGVNASTGAKLWSLHHGRTGDQP